jgi:prephenate dehydratase
MFFADFSGDIGGKGMDGIIRELMGASVSFRVLGNYKASGDNQ